MRASDCRPWRSDQSDSPGGVLATAASYTHNPGHDPPLTVELCNTSLHHCFLLALTGVHPPGILDPRSAETSLNHHIGPVGTIGQGCVNGVPAS